MRLALLGSDADSLKLADAAAVLGHEIAWAGDIDPAERVSRPWMPVEDKAEAWEDLFDPAAGEGVIVGRGTAPEDLRARQVQELVKLGRPVLAVHPLFTSVLTYFEIDMARGESAGVLEHYNPLAESPAVALMRAWVAGGDPDLGPVEQVVATRTLVERRRDNVLWHFERDVELLDCVAGPLDRLGAHAAGGDAAGGDADYSALAIQLSGARPVPVRWVVEPPAAAATDELRVVLICARGRLHVTFDVAADGARISRMADSSQHSELIDQNVAANAVERFSECIRRGVAASSWPAALRSMEMADTIEISLRRGRMIEVHRQELTEHLAFKGTMAALGCGLLAVLIPAVLVAGLIAGKLGVPVGEFLPHILLGLLAIFLVLQLLPRLLFSKPPREEQPRASQEGGS
jgi:hypothetical protein